MGGHDSGRGKLARTWGRRVEIYMESPHMDGKLIGLRNLALN